jgi:hypothetical protein
VGALADLLVGRRREALRTVRARLAGTTAPHEVIAALVDGPAATLWIAEDRAACS